MRKKSVIQSTEGSITIFLSLILILVLSLFLSIIEGARVSAAKIYAERSLSTAMDSVLAEYYGPLWEEYHIFGYYSNAGSEAERREQEEAKLKDYISCTFEPDKELSGLTASNYSDLFDAGLDSISVSEETGLTDYQGRLFINEAVEYMKYKEIGNLAESFLDKLSLLKTPEKVSYIYEEKQKAEEQLVEIDREILNLMELLDGLKTSNKGIEVTKQGGLKTTDYFVKKLCFGDITGQAVGINREEIFLALKSSYVNPAFELNNLTEGLKGLEEVNRQLTDISYSLYSVSYRISEEQSRLGELNAKKKKTEEDKRQIDEIQQRIETLYSDISYLNRTTENAQSWKQSLIMTINTSKNNLRELIAGIRPKLSAAISVIEDILYKSQTVEPLINKYQEILESSRGVISEDIYAGLEEDFIEMKKYTALDSKGYNFPEMKLILEKDLIVLNNTEAYLRLGDDQLSYNWYQSAIGYYNMAAAELNNYTIYGLKLDYGTLVIDKAGSGNPVSIINDLLQNGLMSMVIDKESLSDRELAQASLPSGLAAVSSESTDMLTRLEELFKTAFSGVGQAGTSGIFQGLNSLTRLKSFAAEGLNKLAEQLLFQDYIQENFTGYSYQKEINEAKPSALAYEQEYLLIGKDSDKANLAAVISRLIFLRTILDFVSLVGDSTSMKEAKAVAAAAVGFTGLPILVGITQVLIMLVWSLAEALLDVSALMSGKEIPIIKKEIILELPELFMLSRDFLKTKAEALTEGKGLTSFTYQDYLKLFLMVKNKEELTFRSMDLVQENIKLRYNEGCFRIDQCIFGFKAKAEFTAAPKFINISFLKEYLNNIPEGYHFTKELAYSY